MWYHLSASWNKFSFVKIQHALLGDPEMLSRGEGVRGIIVSGGVGSEAHFWKIYYKSYLINLNTPGMVAVVQTLPPPHLDPRICLK